MDSHAAVQRARLFLRDVNDPSIPVNLERYAQAANARIRNRTLDDDEAGFTVPRGDGSHVITTNAGDTDERQRFTVCHEIAHIILELPSRHDAVPLWAYAKRDPNERLCDEFAAELLMPHGPWTERASAREPCQAAIEALMAEFVVSYPVAASRFAALAPFPCAFVTITGGVVRHLQRSRDLRRAGAWISSRSNVPDGSAANELRNSRSTGYLERELPQDVWFEHCRPCDYLFELARHFAEFDTTTSLLWYDREDLVETERDRFGRAVEPDLGLEELTGELPWPGRSKSRP